MKGKEGIREENLQVLKNLSYIELRLDYQPLFGKMSQDSSPRKSSLRGGSKTVPGRQRKSSLYRAIKKQNTKKKTSPKGKQKKEKKNRFCPESNSGTPMCQAISLPLCHVEHTVKESIMFY